MQKPLKYGIDGLIRCFFPPRCIDIEVYRQSVSVSEHCKWALPSFSCAHSSSVTVSVCG